MRKAMTFGTTVVITLGILSGCTPTQKKPEVEQAQVAKPETIRISKGLVSGRELLRKTDRGFRKWEWWFWNVAEAYDPINEGFVMLNNQPIEVLEYWTSHGPGEPDTKRTEWREEYDAKGQLVLRTTYSDEHGFQYERFTYDAKGRLIKVEKQSSEQDTGFEAARVWPQYSYTLEYFIRTDGEPGIYRISTDFNGKPFQLDRERELSSGWEYMYDPDLGEPTTLRIEYKGGKLSTVTRDFGEGKKEVLSFQYDSENRISKFFETRLDGSSPLFTTEFRYDGQGRLEMASTWDHRTNKQGRIRTFSEHDGHGNWERVETSLNGEINSITIRHLKYR